MSEPVLTYEQTLARWYELKEAIARLGAEEKALREGLFAGTFPNPTEGVNSVTLPDGSVLKGTYVLNRSVNVEMYRDHPTAWKNAMLPAPVKLRIIKHEPKLVKSEYNKLDEKQKQEMDKFLLIKPGLPKLELVPPKPEVPNVQP